MSKILVLYGSNYGQTQKIAEVIARQLEARGNAVTLAEASKAGTIRASDFAGVIVGAPVYAGHFPKPVTDWVGRNSARLLGRETAFFSVCLGILEKENAKAQAEERRIVSAFFEETLWHPKQWAIFAGALKYTQYGWLKKILMKLIARKAGGATDTTRDHEYTDWDEVARFAQMFSSALRKEPPVRSAAASI